MASVTRAVLYNTIPPTTVFGTTIFLYLFALPRFFLFPFGISALPRPTPPSPQKFFIVPSKYPSIRFYFIFRSPRPLIRFCITAALSRAFLSFNCRTAHHRATVFSIASIARIISSTSFRREQNLIHFLPLLFCGVK